MLLGYTAGGSPIFFGGTRRTTRQTKIKRKKRKLAKKIYTFTGKIAWAHKLFIEDEKYGGYPVSFYPKDDADRRAIKATGIKNEVKEDDGEKSGVAGWYYNVRGKEQPVVVDADGNPWDEDTPIGNGTVATIALEVETFKSRKWGEITRSTLRKVRIDELVEYEAPEETEKAEKPATKGRKLDDTIPF